MFSAHLIASKIAKEVAEKELAKEKQLKEKYGDKLPELRQKAKEAKIARKKEIISTLTDGFLQSMNNTNVRIKRTNSDPLMSSTSEPSSNSLSSSTTRIPGGILKKDGESRLNTNEDETDDWAVVCFSYVRVRQYKTELGDNPAVSQGAPITFGWKVVKETIDDVDTYEYRRANQRRRRKKVLVLSVDQRAGILMENGYKLQQIVKATMEADKIRSSRAESIIKAMSSLSSNTNGKQRLKIDDVIKGIVKTSGLPLLFQKTGSSSNRLFQQLWKSSTDDNPSSDDDDAAVFSTTCKKNENDMIFKARGLNLNHPSGRQAMASRLYDRGMSL